MAQPLKKIIGPNKPVLTAKPDPKTPLKIKDAPLDITGRWPSGQTKIDIVKMHTVQHNRDANGNDDKLFKASNIEVAPRPGDSVGPDHTFPTATSSDATDKKGQYASAVAEELEEKKKLKSFKDFKTKGVDIADDSARESSPLEDVVYEGHAAELASKAEEHHKKHKYHADRAQASHVPFNVPHGMQPPEHDWHYQMSDAHANLRDHYNYLAQLHASRPPEIKEDVEAELYEKWDTDYETPKSKQGMFKGRSLSSLRAQDKNAHGTKAKQLAFAIRAKTGWGKVGEETVPFGGGDDSLARFNANKDAKPEGKIGSCPPGAGKKASKDQETPAPEGKIGSVPFGAGTTLKNKPPLQEAKKGKQTKNVDVDKAPPSGSFQTEHLNKKASMGEYIKDFRKSNAPQFEGKSEGKRRQMAIAAKLEAQRK